MYVISAQVLTNDNGWLGSRGIPTFYLDERVQGIINETHAAEIAWSIIDPMGTLELSIRAYKL